MRQGRPSRPEPDGFAMERAVRLSGLPVPADLPHRKSFVSSQCRRRCPRFPDGTAQSLLLFCQHHFPLGNGGLPLQAQIQRFFHFLNAHAALLQAHQILDPFDVVFIKDTAVIFIPFDIGDQPFVAIVFQCLIGHVCLAADLHHGVHGKHPLLFIFCAEPLDR